MGDGSGERRDGLVEAVTSKWSKQSAGPAGDECQNLVAFHATQDPVSGDIAPLMGAEPTGAIGVSDGTSLRRLTPTECERLQALPDGWTDLGGAADSKRYAAVGDAVTATVAEWIGRRLMAAA